MFGSCCCDGASFGTPCCISYTEPKYRWTWYTPTCVEDPTTWCNQPRIEKIEDTPVLLRYCGSTGGCFVRKVTETFTTALWLCPEYDYEIVRYLRSNQACIPGEDLGGGITCQTPHGYSESSRFRSRTIERIYGKSDLQYSCWQKQSHRPFPWYIKQSTPQGITTDSDWYGWWENYCPQDCNNCNGLAISVKCHRGEYETYSTEEKTCDNYCILFEATRNPYGITGAGLTHSNDSSMGGRHYSVNDKEWKDGPYCFGSSCIVPHVIINYVAPYGDAGTTGCNSDFTDCFISINQSEEYKMPNPKDSHFDGVYGVCGRSTCAPRYTWQHGNIIECNSYRSCLYDDNYGGSTYEECDECEGGGGDGGSS